MTIEPDSTSSLRQLKMAS